MKRNLLIAMMFLATAGFAAAQIGAAPSTDVLGAHLNYGRGCAGCHAPHSGAYGNGNAKTADATSGAVALWGEDVASLYGKTITFGGFSPAGTKEILPTTMSAGTPDVTGLLTCLSCHDGNYATGAMMKGTIYESLPPTYGTYQSVPTLFSNASNGNSQGKYLNDHPAGLNATFSCNTPAAGQTYGETGHNWDCALIPSGSSFEIVAGPSMANFINNYGFFVNLGNNAGTPVVVCTTCHNQHLMNVVNVANTASATIIGNGTGGAPVSPGLSGLPGGLYSTMFFLVGPYNPASNNAGFKGTTGSGANQTAQFCRQCHGGESNEMNGGTAGTTF